MSELNLSNHITTDNGHGYSIYWIDTDYVKEFIRLLKDELREKLVANSGCKCTKLTDKYANIAELVVNELAGDRLI